MACEFEFWPFWRNIKPSSELLGMAKDENATTRSNHLSFVPENDFVWENGNTRTRRFPSHCSKPRDNVATTKCRKFRTMDHEFGPSGEMGSKEQDDDMVPLFKHGYCSEFMSATHNHFPSLATRSSVQALAPRNQPLVPPSRSSVSMNFPQFSLPAALVKAHLQNKVKETSTEVPQKVSLRPPEDRPLEERGSTKQSEFTCQENARGLADGERAALGDACSFVCSGNSTERPSDGSFKRKSRGIEDSEWPSVDVEEEPMDVKREARGRSKRHRAAQVHNSSERMRRDRINEKMRALQELIPNCNKVDKASMLDEAIEYLKTLQLQLQLQMMSMGAGLYAPPVSMGMPHMIGGYSGCPMMQVPRMQTTHFLGSPMFWPSAMHGTVGSNVQLFGPPCP